MMLLTEEGDFVVVTTPDARGMAPLIAEEADV